MKNNLKKIMLLDLASLFRRKEGRQPTYGNTGDLWFVRLFRGRQTSAFDRGVPGGFVLGEDGYRPSRYYRSLGRRWRGPVYIFDNNRRDDLLYFVEQIRSIVRVNAPLAAGLEALAREEQRKSRWGRKQADLSNAPAGRRPVLGRVKAALMTRRTLAHCAVAIVALLVVWGVLMQVPFLSREMKLMNRDLLLMTRHLDPEDFIIFAAVALPAALFIFLGIKLLQRRGTVREAIALRMRDHILAGDSLSQTMRSLSRFFPKFYADIVEAGEETGQMEACLSELNGEFQAAQNVRQSIRGTLTYLTALVIVQVPIMAFLMVKVVPVFNQIHQEFTGDLWPGVTGMLTFLNRTADRLNHVPEWVYLVASAVICFSIVFIKLRKVRRSLYGRSIYTFGLLIPGLRGLLLNYNFSLITLSIGKMIGVGLPLERALEKTAAGDINPLYARLLRRVRTRILAGESLADAVRMESGIFTVPSSFSSLIAVGEHSGMLEDALSCLHAFYQHQASIQTRVVVDVVKPFGVLALGTIVLFFSVDMYGLISGLADTMISQL